jgi:hypothetical protein
MRICIYTTPSCLTVGWRGLIDSHLGAAVVILLQAYVAAIYQQEMPGLMRVRLKQ